MVTVLNVTLSDYSSFGALGRYGCLAFAVGNPVERKELALMSCR